jgi:hypothetical protein
LVRELFTEIDMTFHAGALAKPGLVIRLVLLSFFFLSGGCAVSLVGPYDEVTDQSITDLANRTEQFLVRMQTTGAAYQGNEAFYTDAKARLATIRLRAQLYPNNQGELNEIDLLSANLDKLAALHRVGPLTGPTGKAARELIETNFESLMQIEIAKKRSSGVSVPKS